MAINNLSRRPKRNREPLGTAPTPEEIPASRNEQDRAVAEETSQGSGLVSPLTEQSRVTQTVTLTDTSDPSFSIDFEQATSITFNDAIGVEFVIDLTP